MGGNYTKKLLEYIDEDQLADFLGGKNTAKLIDNSGPWNDYEIVDGAEKTDVVGVRKKGDPEGKVFSVQDFDALPNALVDASKEEESK